MLSVNLWGWVGFNAFVLDLGVFHRKSHAVSLKEALTWSVVWIALAVLFNVGLSFVSSADRQRPSHLLKKSTTSKHKQARSQRARQSRPLCWIELANKCLLSLSQSIVDPLAMDWHKRLWQLVRIGKLYSQRLLLITLQLPTFDFAAEAGSDEMGNLA